MKLSNPLNIKTADSLTAARTRPPFIGEYTIFQERNVLEPDPKKILEVATALRTEKIGPLVTYTPERIALHWTIAYITLYSTYKNEPAFSRTVREVYEKYVMPNIGGVAKELTDVWNREKENAGEAGESSANALIRAKAAYEKHPKQRQLIAAAKKGVETAIADGILEPLSKIPSEDAKALVVCAGSGSGKTTIAKLLAMQHLRHAEKNPDDFAHIFRDRFTPVLLGNLDHASSAAGDATAWLGYDEAGHIMNNCIHPALEEMARQKESIPLLVFERSTDIENILTILGRSHIQPYLYFIHVPAIAAMERADRRSRLPKEELPAVGDFRKVIPTVPMLEMHRSVSEVLGRMGERNDMVFELLDNTGREGQSPLRIAFGHSGKKELNIYDLPAFIEFLHKRTINTGASDANALYTDPLSANEAAKCINTFRVTNFVDANTDMIYAHYNPDAGLVIDGKNIYDQIAGSPLAQQLFAALEGSVALPRNQDPFARKP